LARLPGQLKLARMAVKTTPEMTDGADYEVRVIGARRRPLRDFYHALLRMTWPSALLLISSGFLLVNALFALCYAAVGGVAHARAGSLVDAFFFSVQTMGTIGYGSMYPESSAANWLVVLESIVSLIMTALCTGLVFAKFSRPNGRIVFSRRAVISPVNGLPVLMFRIGNERGNTIVDAHIRAVVSRAEPTAEGTLFYRLHELKLARTHALTLRSALVVMHVVDEHSPFYRQTPASIAEREYELQVIVVGVDDTAMQQVHAVQHYSPKQIVWGARLADVLSEAPDGAMLIDLRKFHELAPSEPIDGFSYCATPEELS
jgi:inward rectifier potassium channel